MLAQQDDVFQETCETMFRLNQDEKVRYWCEAREEAERIALTIEQDHAKQLAERDSIIAEDKRLLSEQASTIAEQSSTIAEQFSTITEQSSTIAEQDAAIAELRAQNALLTAQLQQKK